MADPHRVPKDRLAPFSAITRRSRSDEVRGQIQDAVDRGEFKPGDRLPSERELSEVFGVSRVSVREAVSSLTALGVVEVRQGSGIYVAHPRTDGFIAPFGHWIELHRDEVLELLAVRSALDQMAGQRAAERAGAGDIRALKAAHRAFIRGATDGSALSDLAELDIAFHETVARTSRSELILGLIVDLNRRLEESRRAALADPERRVASSSQHGAILAAIEQGDPDAAREAVDEHVRAVISFLKDVGS